MPIITPVSRPKRLIPRRSMDLVFIRVTAMRRTNTTSFCGLNKRGGFLMIEALLAGLLLTGGILVLLNSSMRGSGTVQAYGNYNKAYYLARDLMEDIKSR